MLTSFERGVKSVSADTNIRDLKISPKQLYRPTELKTSICCSMVPLKWCWKLLCRFLGLLLLVGCTPRHVAFIMDGNRRFASHKNMDKIGGHKHGYSKMVDVIHWCLELGVQYISVYAFSIDNFHRSPDEVESLMNLAEEKYKELAQENGLAEKEGIEIRVLGDLALAPGSIQGAAARMMQATAKLKNKRAVLNICFSYIATEEVVQAVDAIREAITQGKLQPTDVSPSLIQQCMHTVNCPAVDLVIRTSGETRLSDFLVWQSSCAQLDFMDTLWPDFGFLDFARCILRYQRCAGMQQRLRKACADAAKASSMPTADGHQQPTSPDLHGSNSNGGSQSCGEEEFFSASSMQAQSGARRAFRVVTSMAWAQCLWLWQMLHVVCGLQQLQPVGTVQRPSDLAGGAHSLLQASQQGFATAASTHPQQCSGTLPGLQQGAAVALGVNGSSGLGDSSRKRISIFLKEREDARKEWIEQHVSCT